MKFGINPEGASGEVPLQPAGYSSTRKLFEDIHGFLAQHPGLEKNSVALLTFFSFAILFPECWGIRPFVSVVAADGAASTLLIRMLECIFVGSVHVGEVKLAGIMSLPESPGNILVIDQPKPTEELRRVLRIMSRPGARVPRKGQLVEIFRPIVLCTAEPMRDPYLLDLAIEVPLMPTRSGLPKFDLQSAQEISQEMRAKLIQYREKNRAKVCELQFDVPGFTSPAREIAALLGNCIVGDSELQARVIPLLRDQEADSRVRRTDSLLACFLSGSALLDGVSTFAGKFARRSTSSPGRSTFARSRTMWIAVNSAQRRERDLAMRRRERAENARPAHYARDFRISGADEAFSLCCA